MSDGSMKALPASTVRLIGSSQVITSVYSVVKELVENALDAGGTTVDVKLDNCGLDKIEVRDNGKGIHSADVSCVAKRYHTSKISSFTDLETLTTYGFRGEALGSLCAVSSLSVITKMKEDDVSQCYTFDSQGNITSTQPSHFGQGTTVCAGNLFKNMPVRRQFYNTNKKKKEEMKRIEDLLMAYGAVRPDLRLTLRHNKEMVWQKTFMTDGKTALQCILGRAVVAQMEHKKDEKNQIEAFFPRCNSEIHVTSRSANDRSFIFVNRRPVHLKDIEKLVKQYYTCSHGCETSRYPIFFLSITLPASDLDVNLEPNKTRVLLHHQDDITSCLTAMLEEMYGVLEGSKKQSATGDSVGIIDSSHQDKSENETKLDDNMDIEIKSNLPNLLKPPPEKTDSVGSSNAGLTLTFIEENSRTLKTNVASEERDFTLLNEKRKNVCQSESRGNENSVKVGVDSSSFDRTTESNKDVIELSQLDRGCFNIVGEEFEDLLSSQVVERQQTSSDKDSLGTNVKETETSNAAVTHLNVESVSSLEPQTSEKMAETDINLNQTALGENEPNSAIVSRTVAHAVSTELVQGRSLDTSASKADQFTSKSAESASVEPVVVQSGEGPNIGAVGWSKGQSEKQTDGHAITEPVRILVPGAGKRPHSPSGDTCEEMSNSDMPVAKKKLTSPQCNQPRLYDLSGSSTVQKTDMAFVAFSKEIRGQVVEENPDADYDEISRIVKQRWDKLSPLDKEQYSDVWSQQVQTLKKQMSSCEKKKSLSSKRKVIKAPLGAVSIKEQLLAASEQSKQGRNLTTEPAKVVRVPFHMDKVKQLYSSGLRQSQSQVFTPLKVIGSLKFYNCWVCCRGDKLFLLNPHRIEETVLHRELMENHNLTAEPLDKPITLTSSTFTDQSLWDILISLAKDSGSHDTYSSIEDSRLRGNGIDIRSHINEERETCDMSIVGLFPSIPLLGVGDVTEILDMIAKTDADNLYKSRPLKVINYLQGEAMRMARQRPQHKTKEDVLDLLEQLQERLPVDCHHCLHNKPFLHEIFDLANVPASQSD